MFYPVIWAIGHGQCPIHFLLTGFRPIPCHTSRHTILSSAFNFCIHKENLFSNEISTFYPETAIHQSSFLSIIPRCNHTKTLVEIWTSHDIKCWSLRLDHNTVKDQFETFSLQTAQRRSIEQAPSCLSWYEVFKIKNGILCFLKSLKTLDS